MIQQVESAQRGKAGEVGGRVDRIREQGVSMDKIGNLGNLKRAGQTKIFEYSRKKVFAQTAAYSKVAIGKSLPLLAEVIWEMSVKGILQGVCHETFWFGIAFD